MLDPLQETFVIPVSKGNFRIWLTDYNEVNEEYPLPITAMPQHGKADSEWHYMLAYKEINGTVSFKIRANEPELLFVTATLFTRLAGDEDGTSRWVLDDSPNLVESFRKLADAIRQKYEALPQAIRKGKKPRKKRKIHRIYGGLIYWYSRTLDISIDEAAQKLDIPKNRYHTNSANVYTEDDVIKLGTSWKELLNKHNQGNDVFEHFLQEMFLQNSE